MICMTISWPCLQTAYCEVKCFRFGIIRLGACVTTSMLMILVKENFILMCHLRTYAVFRWVKITSHSYLWRIRSDTISFSLLFSHSKSILHSCFSCLIWMKRRVRYRRKKKHWNHLHGGCICFGCRIRWFCTVRRIVLCAYGLSKQSMAD